MGQHTYKIGIKECDVTDQARLSTYREHLDRWREWCLSADDPNSLTNQFSSMFWFDAVFRLINESRRTQDTQFAAFNGTLSEALDAGYVAGQAVAIRRLLDRGMDVISLRRVASDVAHHRSLITREVYVCVDGAPYDYEAAQQKQTQEMLAQARQGPVFQAREPDDSQRAHELFDQLSGKTSDKRARDDLISEQTFNVLMKRIEDSRARPFIGAANKFLFHASDKKSRAKLKSEFEITLGEVTAIHRELAQIGNFISESILHEGPCALGVATPQFDVLERLHLPFLAENRRDELQTWWDSHAIQSERLSYETIELAKSA